MNLDLSDKQRQIRDAARTIGLSSLRPRALERHDGSIFPKDSLGELADRGLMGVNISTQYGGAQAGVVAYSLAVTEVSFADPAVAVTMAVNNMVSEVIEYFGTDEQKSAYIPKMTSGEFSSGSFCLSEPGSGSDAAGLRTRADRIDTGWELNGTKAWITSGEFAGIFLVWAKTGDDEISLFLVDSKTPGITVGAPEEKMGQHASNTVALSFDGVQVPEESLLGQSGQGFRIAMMALDGGRIGIASQSLGIADAALDLAKSTEGFSDLATHEISSLRPRLEAARTMTWRAAWLKEQGDKPFSREASIAKLAASEVANDIVNAVYTRWPVGVGESHEIKHRLLEKLLADARVTRIYEGTSEIQRVVIARDLIRRGAL